jgi:MFS family permease
MMHQRTSSPDNDITESSEWTQTLETYQRVDSPVDGLAENGGDRAASRRTLTNFILMSVLFSANHGCVVACLSLATARLGSVGAWQSGILYLTYTGSAIFGATYFVKKLGARDALVAGMSFYCVYVACFWLAVVWHEVERPAALTGAAIGGVGAGFLWTAQGVYFSRVSEEHANQLGQPVSDSTSYLAGIFAFIFLGAEVGLRAMSSVLLQFGGFQWSTIFSIYAIVTVGSTALMGFVHNYVDDAPSVGVSAWYKLTAVWQLLRSDTKMKYMIGLNAAFGFTAAFLNSYVNGEVVRVVLHDDNSKYIGLLTAWLSGVAAVMSLIFGRVSQRIGKGPILIFGALCFFAVVLPFLVVPNVEQWGWFPLVAVYALHGTGRATFEGTLKATFADYFPYEKEGAFANIILQNGLSSAIGYVLTFSLLCSEPSSYCVEYKDGKFHDVLTFELLVVASAVLAIFGFWRASSIHAAEASNEPLDAANLLDNQDAVTAQDQWFDIGTTTDYRPSSLEG